MECGFDLNSALQRDYDSYRDVSRGDLTLSESDGIPVSIIRTLTGVPVAGGEIAEDPVAPVQDPDVETSVGASVESAPVVARPVEDAALSAVDAPLNEAVLDTQRGEVLPVEEAEEVYRADIALWKDNMWGLLGLKLCLEAKGGAEEELSEVTALFNERSSRADIVPAKTCFCAQDAVKDSCC